LCVAVTCPVNTVGVGPVGCLCDNHNKNNNGGFWGKITAKQNGYTGSCMACTAVANSDSAITCTDAKDSKATACKDGYELNEKGTACTTTLCLKDHYVISHTCQKCAEGWHQPAGDSTAGENTVCKENTPFLLIVVVILTIAVLGIAGVLAYLSTRKEAGKVTPDNL